MIVLGAILIFIAIVAGFAFFYGWALMLLLGVIHASAHSWPHPGFWPSVGIGLLLSIVTGIFRQVTQTEHK